MADPDKDRVLKKTITIKRRTPNPYEKKFRRQGEYQYDLPIQSGKKVKMKVTRTA
jgi:hypothetical protein